MSLVSVVLSSKKKKDKGRFSFPLITVVDTFSYETIFPRKEFASAFFACMVSSDGLKTVMLNTTTWFREGQ